MVRGLRTTQKEVSTTDRQNDDFISKRCDICGGEDCAGAALSRLRLICGYGSAYDMERVELAICGECADKIYTLIQNDEGNGQ